MSYYLADVKVLQCENVVNAAGPTTGVRQITVYVYNITFTLHTAATYKLSPIS